jgi:hypothetical protein
VEKAEAVDHESKTEKTEVELIPIHRLKELLLDGTIDHALVCATLWRFLGLWQQSDFSLEKTVNSVKRWQG